MKWFVTVVGDAFVSEGFVPLEGHVAFITICNERGWACFIKDVAA